MDTALPGHIAALSAVFDRAPERALPVLMHTGAPLGPPLDTDVLGNLAIAIASRPGLRLSQLPIRQEGFCRVGSKKRSDVVDARQWTLKAIAIPQRQTCAQGTGRAEDGSRTILPIGGVG